ncbi:MAG: prolipoprotein diacylglyceryl transferase [Thermodesulfobacteriota bacterium]
MHPILIEFGSITIYSYGFFIAAAFLLGLGIAAWQARIKGLDYSLVPDLGFYLIIGAIVGSRLFYILIHPQYFWEHPLYIVQFWKGGLVFLGGAILAAVIGLVYLHHKKQPFWDWADAFSPGIAAGQAVGRIGCLMAGCCYGKTCSLPWALKFTNPDSLAPTGIALHPTQIYHSLAGVITFSLLLFFRKKLQSSGQLFALFMILYGIFRFGIEFFRGDYRGFVWIISTTQLLAMGLILLGIAIFAWKRS